MGKSREEHISPAKEGDRMGKRAKTGTHLGLIWEIGGVILRGMEKAEKMMLQRSAEANTVEDLELLSKHVCISTSLYPFTQNGFNIFDIGNFAPKWSFKTTVNPRLI